jgi:hypothetical protein
MARLLRECRIGKRTAVDEEDVHPAVVVGIEEQPARSHRLDEVLVGAGAVDMPEVDAGLAGDVDKANRQVRLAPVTFAIPERRAHRG